MHEMFATESTARDADGNELLSAYVVRQPNGTWATMMVNKDPARSYRVTLRFAGDTSAPRGAYDVTSFSFAQYEWKPDGANGRPLRSEPPARQSLRVGDDLVVPPYSLTVVKTNGTPQKRQSTPAK
jgi:hypothetical protein